MEKIKTATSEQITKLIEEAARDVASWPSWKCHPEVIAGAKKLVKE